MRARRKLLLALGASLASPHLASAQDKVRRIGFLAARSRSTTSNPDVYYDAFMKGMHELGYVEGKNLKIEWRFADGKYERLAALAAELVRLNVEVIVTHSQPATEALKRATTTIPVVTATMNDPVGSGFAASLAHPKGNITGLTPIATDLGAKQIELLRVVLPGLSRVGALLNPGSSFHSAFLKEVQTAARQFGVKVVPADARTSLEIERSLAVLQKERADAFLVPPDAFFIGQRRQITELALRNRLPSMFSFREYVADGGLISYGQNPAELYRRSSTYVDKILKGAKAGDLPIEQPTKIHLAINLRTAKTLGLTIPKDLLFRADELIE